MGVISKCCVLFVVLGFGCTKKVNECASDSDCKDVAYPFCDVDGQYSPSGGNHNVCTIVPPDCPVDRCGCSPGAVTCTGSELDTCNTDGASTTLVACDLGCATSGDRCFSFKPSNGLDAAMNAATSEPPAVFSLDITVDTEACDVHDSANNLLTVKTVKLTQVSGPGICALVAGSFDVGNVTATGTNALAFAAPGPISIHGKVDLAARHVPRGMIGGGPGFTAIGACVPPDGGTESGGGGNATKGGDGLFLASTPVHRPGGLAQTNFSPLMGGCSGGVVTDGDGSGFFGDGGGALQLDSSTSVTITSSALIALGGTGGDDGGGGGSGGTCIIEAPSVTIAGAIAANGGGGGFAYPPGCPSAGADASNDANPAPGGTGSCSPNFHGGAGGTGTSVAQDGTSDGGGGGSVGRILIRTADGTFVGPGAVFSIMKTLDTLVKI
jgi:hypothetical protein